MSDDKDRVRSDQELGASASRPGASSLRSPEPVPVSASGDAPSRGALSVRQPTLEEATIEAITRATNAAFNWRGQEDLTPVMAINICAAAIAYLRAIPPGHSLEEMASAIENLKLALSSDSDGSPKGEKPKALSAKHDSAGRQASPNLSREQHHES